MKTLSTYINEKSLSFVEMINEEKTFAEYDKELENVSPDMKAVEQIKILSMKFSKTGEQIDTTGSGEDELFFKTERFVKSIASDAQWKKYKELSKYQRDYELAFKNILASWKQLFAIASGAFKKGKISAESLIGVITGIAQFMREEYPAQTYIEHGIKKAQEKYDKLLGQLAAKFEDLVKDYNEKYGYRFSVESFYEENKKNLAKIAVDYQAVQDFKNSFKNHKYLIMGIAGGGNANFRLYDTKEFDNIEECIDDFVKEFDYEKTKDEWMESIKRLVLQKSINSPSLTWATTYYFKKTLKDEYKLPAIGYIDDEKLAGEGVKIYGYAEPDKTWMIRGMWKNKKNGVLYFFDNLWMDHSKLNQE